MNIYTPSSLSYYKDETLDFPAQIDNACHEIHQACKGMGTDEKQLTRVIGSKSAHDRDLIARRYKMMFDKDLHQLIDSETSGDYGQLLELLCVPIEDAEAILLRRATKGAGTDEKILYSILCGRTSEELSLLKKAFFRMYEKDLSVVVADDLSGDLKNFVMACLQGFTEDYDEAIHTDDQAEEHADTLYGAGEGKWGTDEKTFYQHILTPPPQQLKVINAIYAKKHGVTLEKAVDREFSGKVEDALKHHINMVLNPYQAIAQLFEKQMKGFGTDETGLTAAFVRYANVLSQVKFTYEKLYGKTLRDRVHGETSGDYRELLMQLLDN